MLNAAPEFDDCSRIAAEKGLPLKEVHALALAAWIKTMSRFYITTPIYYINAEPHLGHAYTTMVADAIARSRRLMGDDVFFLTGTDEHGQKVERAAQKAGMDPHAFADRIAAKYRDLFKTLNISNDDFIRTTEPRHIKASQAIWQRVKDRGYLYKAPYEGWYCTVDELFVPEAQLVDGRCPTCGNPVERLKEESYFFKLSAFQEPLLELYRSNPDFLTPDIRRSPAWRPPGSSVRSDQVRRLRLGTASWPSSWRPSRTAARTPTSWLRQPSPS